MAQQVAKHLPKASIAKPSMGHVRSDILTIGLAAAAKAAHRYGMAACVWREMAPEESHTLGSRLLDDRVECGAFREFLVEELGHEVDPGAAVYARDLALHIAKSLRVPITLGDLPEGALRSIYLDGVQAYTLEDPWWSNRRGVLERADLWEEMLQRRDERAAKEAMAKEADKQTRNYDKRHASRGFRSMVVR